ncbi:MAG: LamG domain-containing protein, partial [Candidatus Micrarchaeia archaeon]
MQKKGKAYRISSKRYASAKAQSAMEYLMTYGWAILIIAVVLGALFQLGVFNANNFAPKAPPGACQVFRPNGPGTTQFINLEGICSGELPQYVAQFNGQNGYITSTVNGLPIGSEQRTVTAWFYVPTQPPSGNQDALFAYGTQNNCDQTFWVSVSGTGATCNGGQIFIDNWCTCQSFPGYTTLITGTWYFVAFEYNGTYQIGYLGNNGNIVKVDAQASVNTGSSPFYIGFWPVRQYFNGNIANVQIYNTSLSSSEIQALYQVGIGGA